MTITLDKNHPDLPALRAVCAALGKDATRSALTHLLIEDNCAVATDSHRVHTAPLTRAYPDGVYQVIKSTKSAFVALPSGDLTPSDFPSYKRVIPEKTACGAEVALVGEINHDLACCIRALPENRCVNIDYFRSALELFPSGCTLVANDSALRMDDGNGALAVIGLICK
jgi:hypothetical protein